MHKVELRGRVKFSTGGILREPETVESVQLR